MTAHADIGKTITAAGFATNYHEAGAGSPVVLLHGSGPGVTARANWGAVIPVLARRYRVLAPDIVGFGFTERPHDERYDIKLWARHLIGFLDALGLEQVAVVGNSFGGGLALATALRHGSRFRRFVLMGTPAGEFQQTPGLRSAWEYEPSLENMERMLKLFPYDPSSVTPEMVRTRHETSLLHGGQAAFRKLVPPPAPAGEITWVRGVPDQALRTITQPTLVLHGREDAVVPPECALMLHRCIPHSDLHMYGRCGHWVQIEKHDAFARDVDAFLAQVE